MDDRLVIDLKSSAWMKQKKWAARGCLATEEAIFRM
jgi:hypothetical protein